MTRSDSAIHREYLDTIDAVIGQGPFAADWASLSGVAVPRWYREGKFGIFIHWGPFAVPAHGDASTGETIHGDWYGRNMYLADSETHRHHVATHGPVHEFGYKDFIPQFTAEHFDPDAWMQLFRRAGARFVVPVAEHHDGFAMYDCTVTEWNAVAKGPKRDVMKQLENAARDHSLVFGASSHRAENWWFYNGGVNIASDVFEPSALALYGPAAPEGVQPTDDFLEDWLVRTAQLIDKYQPQLLWFDWWIEQPAFKPYLKRLAAYYYNRAHQWGRDVAINYKFDAFEPGMAVLDIERGQTDSIQHDFWQNDTALSVNSWSYIPDSEYKTVGDLIADLVDIVSKNGALLLNVGPRADGTIPSEEIALLEEIGAWLARNGEAIYGTDPWLAYGEGPTQVSAGTFTDTDRDPFTREDIRFTTARADIYATILVSDAQGANKIRSLAIGGPFSLDQIERVDLLETGEALEWSQTPSGLDVVIPETAGPFPVVRVRPCRPSDAQRIPPLVDHF